LVDFGKRSDALREGLIALRRFNLPVRTRLRARRTIKNRLVRMWASESNPGFQVHRLVELDSIDPGTKFGFATKRRDRVVHLHKYLLRHVFRFWNKLLAQNRDREAKYASAMPANQFCECLLVAGLRAGYELGIILQSR
jgi:hypothetical protein